MDYYPDNLYEAIKKKDLTPLLTKIYAYQMFRGLNYLSMLHISHRDIKPQNIMVDRTKHKLIITDFGSAKQLIKCMLSTIQLNPISPTSVHDATELPNLSLQRPITQHK
jgi:serine/threonine protein kinase